jgi:hypothetical protein
VFSLNDPIELEQSLRQAGFADVSVRSVTKELRLPPPADFLWQYIQCTPVSASILQAEENRQVALEREVVEGWRRWEHAGGMTYQQRILIGSGRTVR